MLKFQTIISGKEGDEKGELSPGRALALEGWTDMCRLQDSLFQAFIYLFIYFFALETNHFKSFSSSRAPISICSKYLHFEAQFSQILAKF